MEIYLIGFGVREDIYIKVGRNFQQSNVKNIRFLLNCHNCLTNNLIEIKLAIHLELTIV